MAGGDGDGPERLVLNRGVRSGQPIIVGIDSTRLGPALGGCRIARYPSWQDGVADVARLSSAMTEKAALAGLAYGGGKAVVALDDAFARDGDRRELLHDIGDLVASFDGGYLTAPDMNTGAEDMTIIGERTAHVLCRPEAAGGSGSSSGPTALGVNAAIDAVCAHLWPGRALSSLSFAVHGLGSVGALVAARLAAAGARLVVADTDDGKRTLADSWGARWVSPDDAVTAGVDVLVPCAVGGILTARLVPALRCSAVVGAANNQLDRDDTAELLHTNGICWAPDPVVSAGGIISAVSREREGASALRAATRVREIGPRLAGILAEASAANISPLRHARRLVGRILDR